MVRFHGREYYTQSEARGGNMFVIPVPFSKYHKEMLAHYKELLEYKNGQVSIHPRFNKLITLCCSTNPVRYKTFRQAMKGFSTRTLSNRLNELEKNRIVERQRYNEDPPRVEYRLTTKGMELAESLVDYYDGCVNGLIILNVQ